jgi:hypothetical protein
MSQHDRYVPAHIQINPICPTRLVSATDQVTIPNEYRSAAGASDYDAA